MNIHERVLSVLACRVRPHNPFVFPPIRIFFD